MKKNQEPTQVTPLLPDAQNVADTEDNLEDRLKRKAQAQLEALLKARTVLAVDAPDDDALEISPVRER